MRRGKSDSAFTVIELAVVLSIIAIVIGTIVLSMQSRMDAARIYMTRSRMQTIQSSIEKYVRQYGHLPCPALINTLRTNASYGVSSANATPAACANGTTLNPSATDQWVNYGALPFKVLGLGSEDVTDGWGNRIDYIVTLRYTNTADYKTARDILTAATVNYGQGYSIKTGTLGADVAVPITTATPNNKSINIAYLLLSHGPNLYGGYKDVNGLKTTYTPSSDSPNAEETENSDNDATFVQSSPKQTFDDILLITRLPDLPYYINKDVLQ